MHSKMPIHRMQDALKHRTIKLTIC